ncbi:N-acetylglucosamine-1-phosphotransferase subunits alpha/beta-like [Teleopsis dalmanni]|uniref:N-acetylglucosamine-1-phosphotransferase subunits alpha/beta-like n=1 Tax=Teleopsis dalmanni TaxID=139649 RepID=UPI0018CF18CB|nr:N-acetylglucosamine-1-phosphotransferase subunits alpha/beta-like [Teleopsis dalmanni]
MNLQTRRICLRGLRRRKCEIFFTAVIILVTFLCWWLKVNRSEPSNNTYCMPIDVVYTWVNGSEETFIKTIKQYDAGYDPARYDDKNELRYSLRSLEKYAPWVRRVYIVTNGQIPHWLDLSYDRVSVISHELLSPHPETLPTFSSAAIETFLHRIPGLSKRFLYMNDDIFLGAPLYPDDLYTKSEGVRIYQAWLVPDCADDCPWTYIGDGACDRHCNIKECQFDGGDCNANIKSKSVENMINTKFNESNHNKNFDIRAFPTKKSRRHAKTTYRNSSLPFKELVKHKNLTTLNELRRIVDSYNKRLKSNPKEVAIATTTNRTLSNFKMFKSTKDIYSQSLIYTNMLLNQFYGFKARHVLSHIGFLLDRDIIREMQEKFSRETFYTASHRFRAANDLQFAFVYYSYLMSETRMAGVEEIFNEFDTDDSLTWSDREVRTFLARMYPLPLDWSAVRFFEEVISNCSKDLKLTKRNNNIVYSTLVYERYEDSNLPTITRELVSKCALLTEALLTNFGVRSKYKYNINSKRAMHSNFMMLISNVSNVVDNLDKIRQNPRKFNCINDNLDPIFTEDNELIRHLLEDFYLSFFPKRSKFELEAQYRNRFSNLNDYQLWRRRKRAVLFVGYGATVVLLMFLFKFMCMHKAKFARRYIQNL